MDSEILTLVLVMTTLALAGVVKGTVGVGFPVVAMSMLTVFLDPKEAIGLVALPVLATNAWQAFKGRNHAVVLIRFWPVIVTILLGTWAGSFAVAEVDADVLLAVIGIVAVMFSIISFLHPTLAISNKSEKWVGPLTGMSAGVMGGLTTVHGPPIIMYLTALGLKKDEFVSTIGLIWFCGSIPMVLTYAYKGILGPAEAAWSSVALIPIFAGLFLGEKIRVKIDQKLFKNVLILVLLVLGLNLIRRAFI
ncbi:MAG: putative membrane protein YfcA [Motiliproteus sp.]|jgi:uncharacterized membrane protein YfcA